MKLTINIPETLNEVTLKQYQKWLKIAEGKELDSFLQQKMVEIFCNIPLKQVLQIKASDINKLGKIRMEDFVEEVELDENRYMRGGVRLSFDDDRFGGKKMMIQIGTDTLDVPNSQIKTFLKLIRGLSDSEFR